MVQLRVGAVKPRRDAREADEVPTVPRDKLRPIVGDDARVRVREVLARATSLVVIDSRSSQCTR